MGKSSPRTKTCRGCDIEFLTCWGKQVFCDKQCRRDFFNAREYKATVDRGTCSFDGCGSPVLAKTLCNTHYSRQLLHGSTENPFEVRRRELFWAKVDKTESCWNWTGPTDQAGYGRMSMGKTKVIGAHRFAYQELVGPLPKELDHKCHNRRCVNPDHLRPVTRSENLQNLSGARSDSKSGVRGVHWHKITGKWGASACLNGKSHWLGLFETINEAEAAVVAKRNELFTHNEMDRKTA